jgi:hypothetical protein
LAQNPELVHGPLRAPEPLASGRQPEVYLFLEVDLVSEYAEKLRSIGFGTKRGQDVKHRVVDERDGSTAGVVTEHWDGSSDAAARPKSIKVRAQMLTEEN